MRPIHLDSDLKKKRRHMEVDLSQRLVCMQRHLTKTPVCLHMCANMCVRVFVRACMCVRDRERKSGFICMYMTNRAIEEDDSMQTVTATSIDDETCEKNIYIYYK